MKVNVATTVLMIGMTWTLLMAGCSSGGGNPGVDAQESETFDSTEVTPAAPEISGLSMVQNPGNELSGTVEFSTDLPAIGVVTILDAEGKGRIVRFLQVGTQHTLPLLGMRPESTYTVEVSATDPTGVASSAVQSLTFETGALPDGVFPSRKVLTRNPPRMQPGITMFSSMVISFPLTETPGVILAVDSEGEVIWYYRNPDELLEAFLLNDEGNLLHLAGLAGAREVDLLGNEIQTWSPDLFDVPGVHHDIIELPGGNLATIGVEIQDVDYEEEGQTVTRHVAGDVIIEFTREGEMVHRWSAFDFLDPQVFKEDFFVPFWDQFVDVEGGTEDWMHSNGLVYDSSDDSFILSARHLDWLIKVDRKTGERKWIMGENGDFNLAEGSQWFYHMHAPELLGPGRLMLFDNGNYRPGLEDGTYFSRAVEVVFDEESMEAEVVWEYRGEEPFYSQVVSDSDRLANGNTLVADGGRVMNDLQPLTDPGNFRWSRILEVTPDKEVVWELEMKDFSGDVLGFAVFRSMRLPSIYPEALATVEWIEEER